MKRSSNRARAMFAVPVLVLVGSCRPTDAASDTTASESQAISGGTPAQGSGGAVVLIVHPVTAAGSAGTRAVEECSGTMLTPRLVLTARHCVASTQIVIDCSPTSASAARNISADFDPTTIFVFGGEDRPTRLDASTAARGMKVIDDGAPTLCNHDLALVLLDRPVAGTTIAPIRFDTPARAGELVTLVGWGVTGAGTSPSILQQRTNVPVIEVGPAESVGSAEFVIGDGPCEGDSGGPALAADGAVLGALSRGEQTKTGCTTAGGSNLYTAVASFEPLILGAYAEAGQKPWLDGEPNPLLAEAGVPCSTDGDCQSNVCTPITQTCAAPATSATAAITMSSSGGCAVSPRGMGSPDPLGPVLVASLLAVLSLVARRSFPQLPYARNCMRDPMVP